MGWGQRPLHWPQRPLPRDPPPQISGHQGPVRRLTIQNELLSEHKPRYIAREEHEDARDLVRLAANSAFNSKAQAKRKKVEMLFAHFKRILKLGRLRLRGPCGVQDEFTRAAICPEPPKTRKIQTKYRRSEGRNMI